MNIDLIVNEFNIRGGTHKQVHRLAEYLLSEGDNVIIYTKYFDPINCYPGIDKLTVFPLTKLIAPPKGKIYQYFISIYTNLKLFFILRKKKSLINIHDNGFLLSWLLINYLSTKRKVIWQINDLPNLFNIRPEFSGNKNSSLFKIYLTRLMANNVRYLTVNVTKNSLKVKKFLRAESKVLYCGVDLRFKFPNFKCNTIKSKINLISTGVFLRYRNYQAILQVQKLLLTAFNVESTLKIIGSTKLDPGYAEEIRNLANELNVDCHVLGEVSEDQLLSEYSNSDIFLFLNIDQSWGLAIFEAMNMGLPVIVSDSVGAIEILNHGVDAEIVDPNDYIKIASIIANFKNNGALYRNRQMSGFYATQKMTWESLYCSQMRELMLND